MESGGITGASATDECLLAQKHDPVTTLVMAKKTSAKSHTIDPAVPPVQKRRSSCSPSCQRPPPAHEPGGKSRSDDVRVAGEKHELLDEPRPALISKEAQAAFKKGHAASGRSAGRATLGASPTGRT